MNVTTGITVTALFTANLYTLEYFPSTGGVISGSTPQTLSYGDT